MQARMEQERGRLGSLRVKADSPAVQEVAKASGQSINGTASVLLEDLLRRPHVTIGYLPPHQAPVHCLSISLQML